MKTARLRLHQTDGKCSFHTASARSRQSTIQFSATTDPRTESAIFSAIRLRSLGLSPPPSFTNPIPNPYIKIGATTNSIPCHCPANRNINPAGMPTALHIARNPNQKVIKPRINAGNRKSPFSIVCPSVDDLHSVPESMDVAEPAWNLRWRLILKRSFFA